MELFVALDFEGDALAALAQAGAALSRQAGLEDMRVEDPADLHLTLRYLGSRLSPGDVAERLSHVVCTPFSLTLDGIGRFQIGGDTVLWAGVGGGLEALFSLKAAIDRALTGLPTVPEELPFSPHVTLATLPACGQEGLRPVRRRAVEPAAFQVGAFHLYRIRGRETRPHFEKRLTFWLTGEKRYA